MPDKLFIWAMALMAVCLIVASHKLLWVEAVVDREVSCSLIGRG
jgi:hypothetical protein